MTDCTTTPRQATEPPQNALEPSAWALTLAKTILADTYSLSRDDALRLIACRLELLRHEGVGIGLDEAREVIRS